MKKRHTILGMLGAVALALAMGAAQARAQGMMGGLSAQAGLISQAVSQGNIGQASQGLNALYENFGAGAAAAAKASGATKAPDAARKIAATLRLARPSADKTQNRVVVPDPSSSGNGAGKSDGAIPWGAAAGGLGAAAGLLLLTNGQQQQQQPQHNQPPQNPRNDPNVQRGWDANQQRNGRGGNSGVNQSTGPASGMGNNGGGGQNNQQQHVPARDPNGNRLPPPERPDGIPPRY